MAEKKLIKIGKLKYQWPKSKEEVGKITKEQLQWLLSGLQINPKKCFKEVIIENEKIAM